LIGSNNGWIILFRRTALRYLWISFFLNPSFRNWEWLSLTRQNINFLESSADKLSSHLKVLVENHSQTFQKSYRSKSTVLTEIVQQVGVNHVRVAGLVVPGQDPTSINRADIFFGHTNPTSRQKANPRQTTSCQIRPEECCPEEACTRQWESRKKSILPNWENMLLGKIMDDQWIERIRLPVDVSINEYSSLAGKKLPNDWAGRHSEEVEHKRREGALARARTPEHEAKVQYNHLNVSIWLSRQRGKELRVPIDRPSKSEVYPV
jgi:hypothetical protein